MFVSLEYQTETNMSKMIVDLDKVINMHELDRKEVAKKLFPDNIHQMPAMERILRGESELTASQLVTLSTLIGCEISDLFSLKPHGWRMLSLENGTIRFTLDSYVAIFNTRTFVTNIFDGDRELGSMILSTYTVPLPVYLQSLLDHINKNK